MDSEYLNKLTESLGASLKNFEKQQNNLNSIFDKALNITKSEDRETISRMINDSQGLIKKAGNKKSSELEKDINDFKEKYGKGVVG